MPGLVDEFGVNISRVQLTLSVYLCGLAISQLLYGPLSDRFGRRAMLLGGLAVFVITSILCARAQSIDSLIFWRGLQAIGGASGMVLSRAIIRDLHDRDAAASVIGYITMAWVLAPMLAPVLGGWLEQVANWRVGFWVLAGLGLLAWVATFWKLPETNLNRGKGQNRLRAYITLVSLPDYRRYVLTLAFTSTVFFAFLGGAPYLVVVVFERPPLDYGLWFMFVSIGYMAGNFLTGRYSQRVGLHRMITVGNLLAIIGTLIMLASVVGGIASPVTIFVPMLLVTLGNGLTIPNGTSGAISVDARMIGAAAGLAGFVQMAMGALGSQLSGLLQPQYPFAVIWIMVASALLAGISYNIIGREKSSVGKRKR